MLMQRCLGAVVLLAAGACDSGASQGDTDGETESGSSAASTDVDASAGATTNPGGSDASASGTTTASSTSQGDTSGTSGSDTGLPDGDGCCDPHEGEGCEEVAVEQCVCTSIPQCCLFSWIEECVELAQTRCEATCESDDSGSTGTADTDTDPDPETSAGACEEPVVLELGVGEAALTGNWVPSVSEVGEGDIAVLMGGPSGAVTWDVDVPCEGTWFIWVRYWEQGNDDSYFVTIDGAPEPPAIFEGDCSAGGEGYGWRLLNERADAPCVYTQDPWAPQWDAGVHEVAFSYRESIALGRIVVTNDPEYTP